LTQTIIDCPPVEKLATALITLRRQVLDELVEIPLLLRRFALASQSPRRSGRRKSTLTISGFTSRRKIQRPNRNGIYIS